MALVMLPCELPWWPMLQRHLTSLLSIKTTDDLVEGMQKIHDMCNIGLDPDEDKTIPNIFDGLAEFLECELTPEEKQHFLDKTLHRMVSRALKLKNLRPSRGLHYSLQQQSDCSELDYDFVASLLAHAFFSTFPKRTLKTHPTLQDFNFTHFFTHLDSNIQKSKLRSILHYFDWLEDKAETTGKLKISRQVMSSKQWLTIEDWLECSLPLCPLRIRHEGRLERAEPDSLYVCFSSAKIGGSVLADGESQECNTLSMFPELLCLLLSAEALEDNEVLLIEGARQMSRLGDTRNKGSHFEPMDNPKQISVCCMDAENYTALPVGQFEEDNVLRELNKSLLAFRQKFSAQKEEISDTTREASLHRRLSPIGESFSQTPPDVEATIIVKQPSTGTRPGSRSTSPPDKNSTKKCWLSPEANTLNNRRGRFIVLGSSGECLPVNRKVPSLSQCASLYSSCDSSEGDEFHSAKGSLDDESEDEGHTRRYSTELDTPERRHTFAQRLRDALNRESDSFTTSTDDSSYAVGISIAGSGLGDKDIRLRRGGSRGFMLTEDSMEGEAVGDILSNQLLLAGKFTKHKLQRHNTNESSKYSFSTEYSSELEEVYEQFSRWMENPILATNSHKTRELDARDIAVVRFAGSLLKRTLSESFAGVPLTEGCINSAGVAAEDSSIQNYNQKRNKLVLSARSLSLELARHKHRLAAQLTEMDENENETDTVDVGVDNSTQLLHRDSITSVDTIDTLESTGTVKLNTANIQAHPEPDNNSNCQSPTIKQDSNISPIETNNKIRKQILRWAASAVNAIEQTLANDQFTMKLPRSKISQLGHKRSAGNGLKPISTGNWGCGSSRGGDPQLKLIIQWLSASVAGVPALVYYTHGNEKLGKLDTVCRVLLDRRWTVGELASATLNFSRYILEGNQLDGQQNSLFEELLGVDRNK